MIVTCHSCQTRFRVADEKIGPKGARVRCSRCKAVFSIRAPASGAADDPFARAWAAPAEAPAPAAAAPQGAAPERTIPDLALEETQRTTTVLRGAPEPTVASRDPGLLEFGDVDLSGPDPFGDARRDALGEGPWSSAASAERADDPLADFSLPDLGASPGAPATTAAPLPAPVEAPPLLVPPPAPVEPAATEPPAHPAVADVEQDSAAEAERSRRRLRAVGFNALSLVALVALAAVLFQVWRGRQANAGALQAGPAAAVGVSSAPYVTASGKTVVVVRGRVRVAEPLRRVTVRAELLDGGRPVASAAATAGSAASVEEIHAVATGTDADALARTLAARGPQRLTAGEEVPFTAVIAEPPPNLAALEVRVSLQPER